MSEPILNPRADGACEGFQWMGQSLRWCERCSHPYWHHSHEDHPDGPFLSKGSALVPITVEMADRCRAKWDVPGWSLGTTRVPPGSDHRDLREDEQPEPTPVISEEFLDASRSKAARWHDDKPWTTAEWIVALMGEVGELAAELRFGKSTGSLADRMLPMIVELGAACNAAKKLLRHRDGIAGDGTEVVALTLTVRAAMANVAGSASWIAETLNGGDLTTHMLPAAPVTAHVDVYGPERFATEAADVLAYLVLAVDSVDGADLNAASVAKFNAVSAKHGFPERIGAA